jgi:hypothetical protein
MTSLRRTLGLDRSPLRRPVDRLESRVFVALLVLFALGAPTVGLVAGAVGYHRMAPQAAIERQTRSRTTATVVEDAASRAARYESTWPSGLARVKARWTAADGTTHTGDVTVSPATVAGETTHVWTDLSGDLTAKPRAVSAVVSAAAWLGTLAAAGYAVLLLAAAFLARRVFDRRRQDLWAEAWRTLAQKHDRPV